MPTCANITRTCNRHIAGNRGYEVSSGLKLLLLISELAKFDVDFIFVTFDEVLRRWSVAVRKSFLFNSSHIVFEHSRMPHRRIKIPVAFFRDL